MSGERLSNIALLAVEREGTCRLESHGHVQSLVEQFSIASSRRLLL